jgi:hypothetical protein
MIRRAMTVMLLTGLFTWTVGLFAQRPSDRDSPRVYNVSLIQVIANPNDFNGQRLRVVGYLGRNGIDRAVGVFVSEVDGRNFVLSNSIDLHVEESTIRGLPGKYVVFSGTYHAPSPRSGHNGYVDQILDLKLWNTGDAAK